MGARKSINRYRTAPSGTDFDTVLKKAKAFYKDKTFYITKYCDTYSAFTPSIGFKDPDDAIYYEKQGRRWIQK